MAAVQAKGQCRRKPNDLYGAAYSLLRRAGDVWQRVYRNRLIRKATAPPPPLHADATPYSPGCSSL